MDKVKEDLSKADWVSVKIDAVWDDVWHRINRPHGGLSLQKVLESMIDFSKSYKGNLVTETMLVSGYNDDPQHIKHIAKQILKINTHKSYILVSTRPPAESNVYRATGESLIESASIINSISGVNVECITEDDSEQGFFFTDNVSEDLLSITSVHPIKEKIIENTYEGKRFYKNNLDK